MKKFSDWTYHVCSKIREREGAWDPLESGNPDSVQVCCQAHSSKMWVIQFILKTDEGWEIDFVVIL